MNILIRSMQIVHAVLAQSTFHIIRTRKPPFLHTNCMQSWRTACYDVSFRGHDANWPSRHPCEFKNTSPFFHSPTHQIFTCSISDLSLSEFRHTTKISYLEPGCQTWRIQGAVLCMKH